MLNEKLDLNIGLNEVWIFDSSEYKNLLISLFIFLFKFKFCETRKEEKNVNKEK